MSVIETLDWMTKPEVTAALAIDAPKLKEFDNPDYKSLWDLLDNLCIRQHFKTGNNEYYCYDDLSNDEKRRVLQCFYKCSKVRKSHDAWNDTCDWDDNGMTKQILTKIILGDDKNMDAFTLRNLRSWMQAQILKEEPADLVLEYIEMIISRAQAEDPAIKEEAREQEEENRLNDPRHEEHRYG